MSASAAGSPPKRSRVSAGVRPVDRDLEALQAKGRLTIRSAIEVFMNTYSTDEIRDARTSTGCTLADVCIDWWFECRFGVVSAGNDEATRA